MGQLYWEKMRPPWRSPVTPCGLEAFLGLQAILNQEILPPLKTAFPEVSHDEMDCLDLSRVDDRVW